MSYQIVYGLREQFREVSESGYVFFNFGDDTVNPIDAPDCMPAGSMRSFDGCSPQPRSVWRAS